MGTKLFGTPVSSAVVNKRVFVREEILDMAAREIEVLCDDDIIEITPDWKMKRRDYMALRKIVLEMLEKQDPKNVTVSGNSTGWSPIRTG